MTSTDSFCFKPTDKCISLKFLNKIEKPIDLMSSIKKDGYLVTTETFKLKTVFKRPRKDHHVIFYARDSASKDNEVLLNNNNAISVRPGDCDLPYRTVILSHQGQISNKGNICTVTRDQTFVWHPFLI